jgi:hypothetical protein
MTYVRVNRRSYTEVTEYADPEDEWSRESTATDHSIESIEVTRGKNSYYDLAVPFEVDPSREYYLLYAIYSTGDSFGTDAGQIEYVGLYEDKNVAYENQRRIEQHSDTYQKLNNRWGGTSQQEKNRLKKIGKTFEPYSVRLITEAEEEFQMHVPWNGYFEELTSIEVQSVLVDD